MLKESIMKTVTLFLATGLLSATTAVAQQAIPAGMPVQTMPAMPVQAVSLTGSPQLDQQIRSLQHHWAAINYQSAEDQKEAQMKALAAQAMQLADQAPGYAEPKIWAAIILSTQAGISGGLGALSLASQARDLLLEAEKIRPAALDGSIYTSLGSLYYKVPGWPVSFGDNDKARAYLEQARAINPDGMDPNYFYGDFLIEQGDYAQAVQVLQHALQAPPRPDRPLADAGRRDEILADLDRAKAKL
jgi:tetratricopeptide (TPR) repeat protein